MSNTLTLKFKVQDETQDFYDEIVVSKLGDKDLVDYINKHYSQEDNTHESERN